MPKCGNCGEVKTAVVPVKTDIKTAKARQEGDSIVTGALTNDEYWCKECLDKGEIRQ